MGSRPLLRSDRTEAAHAIPTATSTNHGAAGTPALSATPMAQPVPRCLGTRWAVRTTGWMRRHIRGLQIAGGVMLLVLGTLLVTGAWGEFVAGLRGPISGCTLPL